MYVYLIDCGAGLLYDEIDNIPYQYLLSEPFILTIKIERTGKEYKFVFNQLSGEESFININDKDLTNSVITFKIAFPRSLYMAESSIQLGQVKRLMLNLDFDYDTPVLVIKSDKYNRFLERLPLTSLVAIDCFGVSETATDAQLAFLSLLVDYSDMLLDMYKTDLVNVMWDKGAIDNLIYFGDIAFPELKPCPPSLKRILQNTDSPVIFFNNDKVHELMYGYVVPRLNYMTDKSIEE